MTGWVKCGKWVIVRLDERGEYKLDVRLTKGRPWIDATLTLRGGEEGSQWQEIHNRTRCGIDPGERLIELGEILHREFGEPIPESLLDPRGCCLLLNAIRIEKDFLTMKRIVAQAEPKNPGDPDLDGSRIGEIIRSLLSDFDSDLVSNPSA